MLVESVAIAVDPVTKQNANTDIFFISYFLDYFYFKKLDCYGLRPRNDSPKKKAT